MTSLTTEYSVRNDGRAEHERPGAEHLDPPGAVGPGPAPEHSRAEIAAAAITLADARGLAAVTMRSAAAAIGTAPASLYRYVATRDELVELMADQVYGEISYHESGPGDPVADLLRLAQQSRPSTTGIPGCSTSRPPGTSPGRTPWPSSSTRGRAGGRGTDRA